MATWTLVFHFSNYYNAQCFDNALSLADIRTEGKLQFCRMHFWLAHIAAKENIDKLAGVSWAV